MFLNKSDLNGCLYPEIAAQLSRFSEELILLHLNTAESEIETHLCQLYHIGPELDRTGTARHKLLLQIGRNIAVYYLYQNQETIPTKIEKAYERAAELLKMLANGKIKLAGVPAAPVTPISIATGQIAFGSNPRRPSLN